MTRFLVICLQWICVVSATAAAVTPWDFLDSLQKPQFASQSPLPCLSYWGPLPGTNTTYRLGLDWGYAMDYWEYSTAASATNPSPNTRFILSVVSNNPAQFKMFVRMDRTFYAPPTNFYCTNIAGGFATNGSGVETAIVCPEAPDSYLKSSADLWATNLLIIQGQAPIAQIIDGGEYGLTTGGFGSFYWAQDPRVVTATNAVDYVNMGSTWNRYSSDRKAHQLSFMRSNIVALFPRRELYTFYNTGAEWVRSTNAPAAGTNDFFKTLLYSGWNSDVMVPVVDYPSLRMYYSISNTWLTFSNTQTLFTYLGGQLNSVGYNLALGKPHNLTWLSTGYSGIATDTNLWMGFLKCAYTAGMISAVMGYYDTAPVGGYDASFNPATPPRWLVELIQLAHTHALFSQLASFIFNGDLLPGPYQHRTATDQPAYDFSNDHTNHVIVRKRRIVDQWLVTAWAADGVTRDVSVTIPGPGALTFSASPTGSVYWVGGTNNPITYPISEYSPKPTGTRLVANQISSR